jgi:hypothetical protein
MTTGNAAAGRWTAPGPTQLRGVEETARCLAEIKEGRWPN